VRKIRSFSLLAVVFLLLACGGDAPPGNGGSEEARPTVEEPGATDFTPSSGDMEAFPVTLVDAAGQTLTLDRPPDRIISLVPSASLVLLALDAGTRLVGRTDFDTAQALAYLPSVGGGLNPNLEAVLALNPDLVIRFAGESDPTTPERLEDLDIPHLAVRPDGLDDIRRTIHQLGMVTGQLRVADSILSAMDLQLDSLRSRLADRPRVRVAYLLGGSPPWVAGPGSYLHQLLELAGARNVFSDLKSLYGPVNTEVFLVREMDLILVPQGSDFGIPETSVPIRRASPALEIPGPDLARQAWALAKIIHPEAFR